MRNRRWYSVSLLILGILGVSHLLSGCSSKPVDQNDPAALLEEVDDDIRSDRFQMATDKLRMIKNRFPYSKVAIDAALKLADVYFMQESFAESAAAYEAFADLHPRHEKVPYALFRAAKSYFNDMPSTVARDLGPAARAETAYGEYLKRFPTGAESKEARSDLAHVRKTLADKELYVAEYYAKREMYEAAIPRYKKVLELYPDTETAKVAAQKLAGVTANAARNSNGLDGDKR